MSEQIGAGALPGWISSSHYHEDVEAADVTGATDIDLSAATIHNVTLTGDVTFSFTNPSGDPPGNSFLLIVQQDGTGGHSITWPGAVEWDGGTAPNLSTSAGVKHMLSFVTVDGGTTWVGVPSATEVA